MANRTVSIPEHRLATWDKLPEKSAFVLNAVEFFPLFETAALTTIGAALNKEDIVQVVKKYNGIPFSPQTAAYKHFSQTVEEKPVKVKVASMDYLAIYFLIKLACDAWRIPDSGAMAKLLRAVK